LAFTARVLIYHRGQLPRPATKAESLPSHFHRLAHTLAVRATSKRATRGVLSVGGRAFPCALGRSGQRALKREGDGATPIGQWALRQVFYRSDRIARPRTGLPVKAIRQRDGWCDAPADRNYNRAVRLPYPASSETLFRADGVYDLIVVLSHNERPRMRGGGSAIFIHIARTNYAPTEGCIALRRRDLQQVLATCRRGSRIDIGT
jgi:L,D-peptidoglycan transpeptidase YkuD (ErfK/YbiS/YcfS/YnhG family)